MDINRKIRTVLVADGLNLTSLVRLLNDDGNETSIHNLSNKMRKGTLRYNEALEIASVLGYDIKWIKKPDRDASEWRFITVKKRPEH